MYLVVTVDRDRQQWVVCCLPEPKSPASAYRSGTAVAFASPLPLDSANFGRSGIDPSLPP